jgi:phospholipid/cholesterol/gamma-HCH transport system substrate-binding protein
VSLSRLVRAQLCALSVASIIGVVVLGVVFLRVPDQLGIGKMTIKAQFTQAARLYDRAEVTYRGAPIGSVTALRLIPGGIEADLRINRAFRIPASTAANIHSISAVGEQYVDLTPTSERAPYLRDGDIIPIANTSTPPQIGPILDQADALLAALPRQQLNTLINESYDAFRDVGPDLGRLITNSRALVATAQQTFEPTATLIDEAAPLLDTQVVSSPQIRALTSDLAGVSDQLRASDSEIRGLVSASPEFTKQLSGLFDDLQPTLPTLLDNTDSIARVLHLFNRNLADIATMYPPLVAAFQGAIATPDVLDRHYAHVDLMTQFNDPPPCLQGFIPPAQWRDPADVTTASTPNTFCKVPTNNPTAVRGAHNQPCPNAPGRRAASPTDCHIGFTRPTGNNPPFPPNGPAGRISGSATPVPPLRHSPSR